MSISKNSQNPELDKSGRGLPVAKGSLAPLNTKRHSFAHLMAAAVKDMFPEAQFGVGPVIENGCYYDFILPRTLIPEDLALLENKIKDMLKQNLVFKRQEISLEDAIIHFQDQNQPLKVELLNDLRTKGTTSMSEEERADFENLLRINFNEIENIILDFGGVVFEQQHKAVIQFLKKEYQLSFDDSSVWKKCLVNNSFVESEFWLDYAKEIGLEEKFGLELERIFFETNSVNKQIETLINKAKSENKKVYYLTNTKARIFENRKNADIFKLFDGGVTDLEVGVSKPDVKIYTTLINKFELDPRKSLFIDDNLVNIETAKKLGFQAICFDGENTNFQDILFSNINTPTITLYRLVNETTGEILFEDLCKGPHVEHVKEMRGLGFALDKFSASYWRGDQERDIRMQRVYALVFESKEELNDFQTAREEAKKRDHRLLGQQMEIYTISEDVGAGLPIYLPKGAEIRQLLEKYCYQEAKKSGYQYVYTPHIGKSDLFAKSGHLDHYADGMYAPIDMVNLKGEGALEGGKTEKFYLKPMNCPMHHQVYLTKPRSYRELPYRLYEYGTVYRYEESGTLTGMIRVRGFTQNDAHVYCQTNQLKEVIEEALNRMIKTYKDVGIGDYKIRFSLPDFVNEKEKFGEETEEWINSVSAMRQALDELGIAYYEAVGEAAFYGPKIDIQVKNVNGKEDSLSTIQVDYSIAPKFGITFTNDQGKDEVPAIIHMALMGSVDRFMAFMLEMTAGRLPYWLAPTQVKILTINTQPETMEYVEKVKSILGETVLMKPLKYNELRFEVDDRSESLGKKIREGEMQKVPVLIIVGPKDIAENQVSVRTQEGESKVGLGELKNYLEQM